MISDYGMHEWHYVFFPIVIFPTSSLSRQVHRYISSIFNHPKTCALVGERVYLYELVGEPYISILWSGKLYMVWELTVGEMTVGEMTIGKKP